MSEYRRIIDLREILITPTSHLAAAFRKQRAEDGISDVLRAVRQKYWALDAWTSHCLNSALVGLRDGKYDDARANTATAICPVDQRDADYTVPPTGIRTLEELQAELARLRTRAVK